MGCTKFDSRESRNKNKREEWVVSLGLGTNTTKIEKKLRRHKEELEYKEPVTKHRWDSEEAKEARKIGHNWSSEEAKKAAKRRWDKNNNEEV